MTGQPREHKEAGPVQENEPPGDSGAQSRRGTVPSEANSVSARRPAGRTLPSGEEVKVVNVRELLTRSTSFKRCYVCSYFSLLRSRSICSEMDKQADI